MPDIFSKEKRSQIMSKISGKNTKPEKTVRSLLHGLGYRFRLHVKELPGKPDICLPKYRVVILINGCYWHRHKGCKRGQSMPSSNVKFWLEKFEATVRRDKNNLKKLKELGWVPIVVWECEVSKIDQLEERLTRELSTEKD